MRITFEERKQLRQRAKKIFQEGRKSGYCVKVTDHTAIFILPCNGPRTKKPSLKGMRLITVRQDCLGRVYVPTQAIDLSI